MATLTSKITLSGTAADFGQALALNLSKDLTIEKPWTGVSKINVINSDDADGAAAPNILLENKNARRFVYIKHNGIDSAGATVTTDLIVKNFEGDVAADGTQIMVLKTGEWAFFPYDNGTADPTNADGAVSDDDDNALILDTSSGTINCDFAIFTVAS